MRVPAIISFTMLAMAGFGLANWHMARSPLDVTPIAPANPARLPVGGDGVIALSVRGTGLRQASERPLFATDRRPWAQPQTAAALLPKSPPELLLDALVPPSAPPVATLVGIQRTPDGSMVLLSDQSGAAPVWLKDGEDFQDWQVGNITSSSADLKSGTIKITLELYPADQPGPAAP